LRARISQIIGTVEGLRWGSLGERWSGCGKATRDRYGQ